MSALGVHASCHAPSGNGASALSEPALQAASASEGIRNSEDAAASRVMCFFMAMRLNPITQFCNPTLRGIVQIAREAAKSKVI